VAGDAVSARTIDRVAAAAHALLALALLGVGVAALATAGAPAALDPSGAWLDDGWSRIARGALCAVTGISALGLVRVRGLRRLGAGILLAVAALGLSFAAGAQDVRALWAGPALAAVAAPLAIVIGDERRRAARHAFAAFLLGALATGLLGAALVTLAALAGSTHLVEIGFLVGRFVDASPLALAALRVAVVAAAILAAWAPFHLATPELWGEGSAPVAGWLAIAWPWAGWSLVVRLSTGLAPALESWSFDAAAAVGIFLVLGAIVPALAALAEVRAGRLLALLAVGTSSELLLAIHAAGTDAGAVAVGLLGYGLAWIATAAALAGVRAAAAPDDARPADHLGRLAGFAARRPRVALALALAALLWAGLPGTFSLATRGELWRAAEAPAGLVLLVVAGGGFLRVLAVGRLVRTLWFRAPVAPDGAVAPDPDLMPAAVPLTLGVTSRWTLAFVVAMAAEFGLGLFAPGLPAFLRAIAGALAAG
jgi:NADH:ubiquinone oxidoreductase subunit 2 (subunit N)